MCNANLTQKLDDSYALPKKRNTTCKFELNHGCKTNFFIQCAIAQFVMKVGP